MPISFSKNRVPSDDSAQKSYVLPALPPSCPENGARPSVQIARQALKGHARAAPPKMLPGSNRSAKRASSAGAMSQRGGLPTHSSANSAVFVAFLAALLIAPFGNGAGSPVAMAVSAFCFGAIALALAGDLVWSRTAFAIAPARLALALSCFGAVAAWCLVQAWVPVPPGFADPGWSILGEALHIAVTGRISAAPVNTLMATTKLMTAGLVFFTALQLASDPARSIVGIRTILLIIVAYSIWGVIDVGLGRTVAAFGPMDSSSTGSLPGMAKSTLPNPNHFATLCLMGLASALTLVLRDIRRLGAKLGMGSSRLADFAPICGDGSCVIILLVALYLSKSVVGIRLGFVIFTVVIGIVMLRFRSSGKTRHGFWTLAALGLAIAFLLASFFGADFPARPTARQTRAGLSIALFSGRFSTMRCLARVLARSGMCSQFIRHRTWATERNPARPTMPIWRPCSGWVCRWRWRCLSPSVPLSGGFFAVRCCASSISADLLPQQAHQPSCWRIIWSNRPFTPMRWRWFSRPCLVLAVPSPGPRKTAEPGCHSAATGFILGAGAGGLRRRISANIIANVTT